MNKMIRLASLTALMTTAGMFATGCECVDQGTNSEGQNTTVCESLQKFEGTSFTETVPYTAGMALNFDSVNGNVDVRTGSGSDVTVEFTPFSVRGHSKADEARQDMENDLTATATGDGSISINVNRADGSFNGLGADVVITLPSSFDGAVNVDVGNGYVDLDLDGALPTSVTVDNDGAGDIDVTGARGALNIAGDFDVDVEVAAWGAVGENGSITTDGGLGQVTITLPTASAGSIQATSDSKTVIGPNPLPEFWAEDAAAENSKTFSFGIADPGEDGAIVTITAGEEVTVNAR